MPYYFNSVANLAATTSNLASFHTWAWLPWSSAKGISSWTRWIIGWMWGQAEKSASCLLPKIGLSLNGYPNFDGFCHVLHHFPHENCHGSKWWPIFTCAQIEVACRVSTPNVAAICTMTYPSSSYIWLAGKSTCLIENISSVGWWWIFVGILHFKARSPSIPSIPMQNGAVFSQVEALSISFSRFAKLIGKGLATQWYPTRFLIVLKAQALQNIDIDATKSQAFRNQIRVHGTSKISPHTQ